MPKQIEIDYAPSAQVLLVDGSIADNTYTAALTDDDSVSENTIVSVEQLAKLADVTGKKGVLLTVNDDVETLLDDNAIPLQDLDIISIYFANFNDGRGYSYASLLRRHGYEGELRAVGDVFKDTLFYMKRCGFASFELKAEKSLEESQDAFNTFTAGYQAIQTQDNNFQTGA